MVAQWSLGIRLKSLEAPAQSGRETCAHCFVLASRRRAQVLRSIGHSGHRCKPFRSCRQQGGAAHQSPHPEWPWSCLQTLPSCQQHAKTGTSRDWCALLYNDGGCWQLPLSEGLHERLVVGRAEEEKHPPHLKGNRCRLSASHVSQVTAASIHRLSSPSGGQSPRLPTSRLKASYFASASGSWRGVKGMPPKLNLL